MIRPLAGLLLAAILTGAEAEQGVAAYWAFRERDHGQPIEHQDVTATALRDPAYAGTVSAVFYRFQWEAEEGRPQHQREVLLLLDGGRLAGWYNISGSNNDFAAGRFDGSAIVLPAGVRIAVWPPPQVLVEPAQASDEAEQRFLFHPATPAAP